MNKRAILYARVSTDEQADRGYSLPSQLDLCRKYAERLGYSVVEELREDYSGATPIGERPTGKQLAAMVKARSVDAVIVYQVDRLSRDIVNLLATVQMWIRAGIEVHTCDIGKIESELDIVLVIKGWQGSDERKKIRERTMRGKQAKAQSGRVVGCRAPYGYRHIRDANGKAVTLEIDENTAPTVRLIYNWYVRGDENGNPVSARGIARRLAEMHIPTPGELQKGYGFRKRGAGMWQAVAVLDVIAHQVYAGVWRFGGCSTRTSRRRPPEEQIAVSVPSIIDPQTWERAQAQRKRNKAFATRNAKRTYLLRGLIQCGCGAAMCGATHKRAQYAHTYYSCNWRANHHSKLEKRPCQEKPIRTNAIEKDIWEGIRNRFADIEKLEKDLQTAQQQELDAQEPKRDELEAVEGNIMQTEKQARELAQAFERTDPEGVVAKSLLIREEEVNARYAAQIKRRAELQADLGARRLTNETIGDIIQYARDIREGIENADESDKRHHLEILGVKIKITQGHFWAKCVIGEWDGEVGQAERAIVKGSS